MLKNILVVSSAFLFVSCSSLTRDLLKDPEVQVTDVRVTNVSLKDISVNLKLNVVNPNAVPLNLGKVVYALQFSGQKVTEGSADQGIKIPASGSGEVVLPLKFEYNAVGSLIEGFMKKTLTKEYELTGSAQFGIFSIPFHKKGEVEIRK